jgi:hypothetical protein
MRCTIFFFLFFVFRFSQQKKIFFLYLFCCYFQFPIRIKEKTENFLIRQKIKNKAS